MDYGTAERIYNAITANDGATVSTHGETLPLAGFYVSDPHGAIFSAETFGARDVVDFANAHALALSESGVYLGGWVSDGKVYLDVTRHFYSRDVALDVGARNGQLAIWDVANADEIAVAA